MVPLLFLTPAWLTGIFLGQWLKIEGLWLSLGLCLGGVLAGVGWLYSLLPGQATTPLRRSVLQSLIYGGLLLAIVCLGGWRVRLAEPSTGPDGLLYYLGQPDLTLVGVVSGEPGYTTRSENFRLNVEQIRPSGATEPQTLHGEVFVQVAASIKVQPGDRLELVGKLAEPKELLGETFPYRDWLFRQGIYTTLSYPKLHKLAAGQQFFLTGWFAALNQSTRQVLSRYIPDEEGGLLAGILLGDKSGLSSATRQDFTTDGLTHIIVVSGSNISIMILLLTFLLNRLLNRRTTLWLALGSLAGYVLLVGLSPSVNRAAIMGGLAIIGLLLGREYRAWLGLSASAFLMTLWWPFVLLDIGFQLSFMATLGLIWLARPWTEITERRSWPRFLQEGLVLTLAAELLTLPLTGFYFHQISLVSVLANLLVIPLLVTVTALGSLLLAVAWLPLVGPFLALPVGGVAWLGLAYILAMVKFCAILPLAALVVPDFHPIWLFIYYAVVGLALWWSLTGRKNRRVRQWLVMSGQAPVWLGLASLTGVIWLVAWLI